MTLPTDEELRDLFRFREVLQEFAEEAGKVGHLPSDDEIVLFGQGEVRRRRDAARKREERELRRLEKQGKVEKVCVVCGDVFVVMIGVMGRPRTRCGSCSRYSGLDSGDGG